MRTVFIIVSILIFQIVVVAAVPPMINYQGKLLKPDGVPVIDATYSMTFAIYDKPVAGVQLWGEQNPTVQVKKGLFSVLLGSVVNLPGNIFDSPDRFFGVKVGVDPEMAPRQQITTAAYAFKAAVADKATIADTVAEGSITTKALATSAVTTDKLKAGAVTTPVLATGAVTSNTIADGAVTATKLGTAITVSNYQNPEGSSVISSAYTSYADTKITIPGPGKVLVIADVTFQPALISWVSLSIDANQGDTTVTTVGSHYIGGDGTFYITLTNSKIFSLPQGGEWTIRLKSSTNGPSVRVHTYTVNAVYVGQ